MISHGTTVGRSSAMVEDICRELHGRTDHVSVALRIAVDNMLALAREGFGAPLIECYLADISRELGIME
jgi:hypothetical protein